jgi:hypothetical protein
MATEVLINSFLIQTFMLLAQIIFFSKYGSQQGTFDYQSSSASFSNDETDVIRYHLLHLYFAEMVMYHR